MCGFPVSSSPYPPQQVCTPAALRCYKHVIGNHSDPCVGHLYCLSPSCTILWEVLNASLSSCSLKLGFLCEEAQQGAVFSEVQCSACMGFIWRSTGAAINTLSRKSPFSYRMERRQQPKSHSRGVPANSGRCLGGLPLHGATLHTWHGALVCVEGPPQAWPHGTWGISGQPPCKGSHAKVQLESLGVGTWMWQDALSLFHLGICSPSGTGNGTERVLWCTLCDGNLTKHAQISEWSWNWISSWRFHLSNSYWLWMFSFFQLNELGSTDDCNPNNVFSPRPDAQEPVPETACSFSPYSREATAKSSAPLQSCCP